MIVTDSRGLVLTADERTGVIRSRCLARRGMLYSECEAVDYLLLAPGAAQDARGQSGVELAVLVLGGSGELSDTRRDRPAPLRPGALVLAPAGSGTVLRNTGEAELELLLIAVFPESVTGRLPIRKPVERPAGAGDG
ncbi:cupin domain-containing protein [Saccharopolyspora sp. HNM0986]|uniref:cupin domain-containing protein n=1 Tax=Saccharopolyspora galaxeae TaxID=2781241 RepID=UPI00190A457A|nr:cupin domain-containing protein [Saccharopolyspora sp. HNM0986]MBK0870016.1 cupin domain-containing protein [Saccharopolyspora sp. HNM0986]